MMLQLYMRFLLICTLIALCYSCPGNLTSVKFNEGFVKYFGYDMIVIADDGKSVSISINNRSSSGFISQKNYNNALFSASIMLPPQNYTAGVIVTFYLSNSDQYRPEEHDEIDFEFLGHAEGEEWILQTNFYGNGSIARGREERYKLWFDPSEEAHQYSIFWSENRLVYYVDTVPIREVQRVDGMGEDYPSKPMSLYATIWDGSSWATDGGRLKINHTFDPFVAGYSDLSLNECSFDPIQKVSYCGGLNHMMVCGEMTPKQLEEHEEFRRNYLTYSYCNDTDRYSTPFPECLVRLS